MAGLERRLAEAEAALASLDEVVPNTGHSLIERDSAILRLIYTFEAVWKACQQLLGERKGIEVASPDGTIRVARRLGWLSDDEAQAAIGSAAIAISRFICIAARSGQKSHTISPLMRICCAAGLMPCGDGQPRETNKIRVP